MSGPYLVLDAHDRPIDSAKSFYAALVLLNGNRQACKVAKDGVLYATRKKVQS